MVEEESSVTSEDRVSHFQNLSSETQEPHTSFNFPNENLDIENDNSSDAYVTLETPITTKEIHDHISKLNTKKASGMDSILNEMIKCGRYYLVPTLQKLVYDIINKGPLSN